LEPLPERPVELNGKQSQESINMYTKALLIGLVAGAVQLSGCLSVQAGESQAGSSASGMAGSFANTYSTSAAATQSSSKAGGAAGTQSTTSNTSSATTQTPTGRGQVHRAPTAVINQIASPKPVATKKTVRWKTQSWNRLNRR